MAPEKLSFCFKCPDTGTVRILGNILYLNPCCKYFEIRWGFYLKLKVSWLRAFLWCMSQTSRDQDNSRRVRNHEKNSGETVRRLGTIIQSIFCAPSGAGIGLNFWKELGESRYPGTLSPVLENFRPALSPGPTDCPWVSEDWPRLETSLFYVIWETWTEDIRKFSDVSVILELLEPKPQNLGFKRQVFLIPRSFKITLTEGKGKEKKKVQGERKEEKRKNEWLHS